MEKTPSSGSGKTSLCIDENVEGLLAYLGWWITGIIFLVLEKDSYFVRFHAMQSTVTFLGITVLGWIFGIIPFVGWVLANLTWLLGIILWILEMLEAYQGKLYKFPYVGDLSGQWLEKVNI
ncbi:DUF4870 domain-containing protein [Thermococcus sp. Bubb.Bath]|uniref:DUF4870 domain-containing protein n=1 Tax=Thermococcus sp. Bubb.Bath TaxID=1638242 RepID=UPI0014386ECE|nr:DUF4870 domain-containing protein [Thermococcus sp. Bubb.Bath]NJF25954.1 DUF4870 domain-containing protein [Thermococcus sp. Bubb.Bath]